jgi:3-oxoadipate enol-lactonase
MAFADIRGRKIYYEIHGEGEPIFLLHHGFAASKMWEDVFSSLVEAGYQTIMFDRRGYGKSEPGADFEEFYLSDTFVPENVTDMAELARILNLDRFSIVGQCEGGVVGVQYAGRFPQQVKGLVIASTLCFSDITLVQFNKEKFPKAFHELDPPLRDKFIKWHGSDYAETLYEMARTKGGAYGVGFFDIRPKLPFVLCPTLILYPDRSALFKVEQAVEFYRNIENAELAVIPKCGHNTYEQKPEEYIRHVVQFLERTKQKTDAMDFNMTCLAPAPPKSETA